MSLLDVFGFVTGALSVWLCVRKNVWNWPVGIANSAVFLVSFATVGLYADAALQIVYVVLGVYGWVYWLRGGDGAHEAPVTRLPAIGIAAALAFVVLATWLFAAVLSAYFHSTVPLWDGLTTALSLAAQFLLSRKVLENWFFWIAADVIYVPLYAVKGLPLTALLYVIFLAMCVAGAIAWNRSLHARPALA